MNINTLIKNGIKPFLLLFFSCFFYGQVTLEKEVKISDIALHFDGNKVSASASNSGNTAPYDYFFGKNISAHGDCITHYKQFVFMTWYRGGKTDRHVMLTRYNTITGTMATIEFPHRHSGYQNIWWIGESHNTIAVGVSPLDGTVHMLYDMHAYGRTRPSNGSLSDDYFRYSYSVKNAAEFSDEDFTLDKFVKNNNGGYKHLSLNGGEDYNNFAALTYPKFFLNNQGDLFMYMREGGNNNGAYKFSKYTASTSTWSAFTHFNILNAKSRGTDFNWGLYGNMKYINGKLRIGFQRRSANNNDKYQYQNGVYYAYSDDQSGASGWKNHQGQDFDLPLIDADFIKVMEPGDYVQTTQANKVYIVGGFDWTVTKNGDVHMISEVKDNQFNKTKYLHTYKPIGATDFITSEEFAGGSEIYTSGDDIYLIGLNSIGRVYVEKAKGGTNNFRRVYEATSGKRFDHGQVYIFGGKLYYYLMERSSGNAQPIYLQIIDLDENVAPNPLSVNFSTLSDNQVLKATQNVNIAVDAFSDNGTVTKVEFVIDDNLYFTDDTAPFETEWQPTTPGNHTIKAIAYSSANEQASKTITVIIDQKDYTDLRGDIYKIKNVATGNYLKSEGSTIVVSATSEDESTHWQFLKSPADDNYYNIDSQVSGTIRITGSGELISSSKNVANADVDKIWTVLYHETDKTYTFQAGNGSRYLSNSSSTMGVSNVINDESKWTVESTTVLSIKDQNLLLPSIKVYPNPAKENFTIQLSHINSAEIKIYSVLGKLMYHDKTKNENILIKNTSKFKTGVYIIKVFTDNQKVYNKKLVIE